MKDEARAFGMAGVRVLQMVDPAAVHRRRSPHHAVNLVILLEQKLGEVRTVLARDACDECSLRHRSTKV